MIMSTATVLFFSSQYARFMCFCLTELTSSFNTMLKIRGEREQPCLLANCNGKDSNFSH